MLADTDIRKTLEDGNLEIRGLDSLEEQLQPIGVDLRIGSDYLHKATGTVYEVENSREQVLKFEPNVFYNVHTVEEIKLPRNLAAKLSLRTTFEQQGLSMSVGSIAPGFEGKLVFGLSNRSEQTIKIEPETAVFQIEFYELSSEVETGYGEKETAQYQHQSGVENSKE